jgi:Eukaryotic initiation factor 4E
VQVYHVVGEQFPNSTDIVGVALNLRKTGARLALWTRTSRDEIGLKSIGREFRSVVHLPASKKVGFASHADSKHKQSSRTGGFYWSGFKGDMSV